MVRRNPNRQTHTLTCMRVHTPSDIVAAVSLIESGQTKIKDVKDENLDDPNYIPDSSVLVQKEFVNIWFVTLYQTTKSQTHPKYMYLF